MKYEITDKVILFQENMLLATRKQYYANKMKS